MRTKKETIREMQMAQQPQTSQKQNLNQKKMECGLKIRGDEKLEKNVVRVFWKSEALTAYERLRI